VAAQAGVPSTQVEAVLDHPQGSVDRTLFDSLECRVLDFTDAVVCQVKAPPEMFDALAAQLPPQQLMEIVMTIGYYMLVCRVLENFEVDLEGSDVLAGHAPWAEILRQN
jgi:hypothetical protein